MKSKYEKEWKGGDKTIPLRDLYVIEDEKNAFKQEPRVAHACRWQAHFPLRPLYFRAGSQSCIACSEARSPIFRMMATPFH